VANRNIFYFRETVSDTTASAFSGPYTLTDLVFLLRAQVNGSMILQPANYSTSTVIDEPLIWGLQWVASGDSPMDTVEGANGYQWLWRQQMTFSKNRLAWAPSTDTAAYITGADMDNWWQSQMFIDESIDLYVCWGNPFGASVGAYTVTGTLDTWWE
jgi:hypothetical protein